MSRSIAIVSLMLLTGGCSALSSLQTPTASVKGMNVANLDAKGFVMNFDVDIANPNAIEIPLAAADYKLGLAGVKAVSGGVRPGGALAGGLKAGATQRVTLPVNVSFEELLSVGKALAASGGNVPFDLDASFKLQSENTLFGGISVPVKYSGTLPLKDLLQDPMVLLKSPAARKVLEMMMERYMGK